MTHDPTPIAAPRLDTTLNRARVAPLPQLKSQQICTIGAPDAYRVDYQTLCEVPTPETTYHPRSGNAQWQPVPYASFVNGARDAMANVLNQDPVFETYALNNSGSQMFGMIGFGSGITGQAITVALRSSLDKTIAPAAAIGSAPFVCANGCFSGDFMISAKQTTNVFGTLGRMFNDICDEAVTPVLERIRMVEGWRDIPVKNDLFGAYMGVLFSRGLVKPQEFTAAFRYWNACHDGDLHNEHGTFDLFSAYQAVTAAGQRTAPRNAFRHFAGIDHATKAIAEAGGSVTEAYIPSFDLQIREYVDAAEAK
tara:strand:+ start:2041 stop:2967 length:927 start_codon:yes stop_codon:yes gene_type:complete